jgi:hypothetical protein
MGKARHKKSGMIVTSNDFINAKFEMTATETKMFISMLGRITDKDKENDRFETHDIPISEIVGYTGGATYSMIKDAADRLSTKVIKVEGKKLNTDKKYFDNYPLIAVCSYADGSGYFTAQFNDKVKPLLLHLSRNFTKVQLLELYKLRSFYAIRLYWFLKQYQSFGERTVEVERLKEMMCLEERYEKYANFKQRILEPVRLELQETDMPFTYTVAEKKGRAIHKLKFSFSPAKRMVVGTTLPLPLNHDWEKSLVNIGVSNESLPAIMELIVNNMITPDYIQYCINHYKEVEAKGGIKASLASAVYTAVINRQLWNAFSKLIEKRQKIKKKPEPQYKEEVNDYQELVEIYESVASKSVVGKTVEELINDMYKNGYRKEVRNGREVLVKQQLVS